MIRVNRVTRIIGVIRVNRVTRITGVIRAIRVSYDYSSSCVIRVIWVT